MDARREGTDVCGEAEFGSGRPEHFAPQMEIKGQCLALPKLPELKPAVPLTAPKQPGHVQMACHLCYPGNRPTPDSPSGLHCPCKARPATYFQRRISGGGGEQISLKRPKRAQNCALHLHSESFCRLALRVAGHYSPYRRPGCQTAHMACKSVLRLFSNARNACQ